MDRILFYNCAEFANYASKMTIEIIDRYINIDLWNSYTDKVQSTSKHYFSKRRARREYQRAIGKAILGGWKVLSIPYLKDK